MHTRPYVIYCMQNTCPVEMNKNLNAEINVYYLQWNAILVTVNLVVIDNVLFQRSKSYNWQLQNLTKTDT